MVLERRDLNAGGVGAGSRAVNDRGGGEAEVILMIFPNLQAKTMQMAPHLALPCSYLHRLLVGL